MDARVRDFLLLIRSGGGRSVVPEKISGQIQGKFRVKYAVFILNYSKKMAKNGDFSKLL